MAVLEKIRVKFGILITVLVALALLSFIIDPQTLQSAFQMLSSENKVGEMNGKNISYRDFYENVDRYTKLTEMMGQSANDERAQASIREAAWQEYFTNLVFTPKATEAGLFVGDQEMYDLTQGTNISPILLQQGMFADENGNFSRAALANFVQNIDGDASGQSSIYWNFLEKSIYDAQLYSKYNTLFAATALQNNVEKARLVSENNVTYDVEYVTVPMPTVEDTTVVVTNADIKKYYKERKNNLKQPANRDIEFVMYEVVPSAEDIAAKREEFNTLYDEFKATDNLRNFVTINSDSKWDAVYYSKADLENIPEYKAVAFGGAKNATSAVVENETSFAAARVADRKMLADSAKVYYAAFALTDEASADALVKEAKASKTMPEKFIALSESGWISSAATAANGLTDLDVAFNPQSGKVIKVRSISAQAYLVLYVTERTRAIEKVQLATLVKNILPSEETYRDFLMKATELADKSGGKYSKFAEVCSAEQLPVIPMQNLVESTRRIGVCENARELVRWIFEKKTRKGDVSDVIVVDNKYYFVAAVTEVRKEGYIDVKDVAEDFTIIIRGEKMLDNLVAKVSEEIKPFTTLKEVEEFYNAPLNNANAVSFGSQYQQVDPSFLGALANSEVGKICGPIKTNIGVVVYRISAKNEGSFYVPEDASTYASQKASYQNQMLESVIAAGADIKDNRARFF